MHRINQLILTTSILLLPCVTHAHHGQDFLLLQDASSPRPLDGNLFSNFEWSREGNDDEFGLESGMQLGIAPRLSLGAAVEFGEEGKGWDYSSVMPYLHLDLTPKDFKWPIRIAIMGGYQFANHDAEDQARQIVIQEQPASAVSNPPVKSTVKHRSTATQATVPPATTPDPEPETPEDPGPCGPEYGPDAPPCPETLHLYHTNHVGHQDPVVVVAPPVAAPAATGGTNYSKNSASDAKAQQAAKKEAESQARKALQKARKKAAAANRQPQGIHRHDENYFFGRLIVEADLTNQDKFVLNILSLVPESGKPAWGYGAGLRHSFTHTWAVGLEAQGDFGDSNEHELVLGGYFSPVHTTTFKLGVGCGLTDESADFSLRTGLVWRF